MTPSSVLRPALACLLLCASAGPARADPPSLAQEQAARVESLRKEVADQLQLRAYDLLDELVYGWTQAPPFPTDTPVVLADVTVPLGFSSGLQALLENHFVERVTKNRPSHLVLAHCPACSAVTVHAMPTGTLVTRGVDAPETLRKAGLLSGAHHALFLDFEIEGAALVLRARITALGPALPIVFARSLSSDTSAAALLRSGEPLKGAAEARQEYLELLQGRGLTLVPLHLGLRAFGVNRDTPVTVAVDPFIWLEGGAEVALTQARAWTGSLTVGVSWAPDLHTAFLLQGRISRLLTGSSTSLTYPDLYAFLGGSILDVYGSSALGFLGQVPSLAQLKTQLTGTGTPNAMLGAFQLGLELRIKNRLGFGAFLETMPGLPGDAAVGTLVDLGIVRFQTLGAEISVCF